ncbi:MAG: hypothetical protein M3Q36_00570, partial [bacterium]|nr:hypothetical protein [bacterium]
MSILEREAPDTSFLSLETSPRVSEAILSELSEGFSKDVCLTQDLDNAQEVSNVFGHMPVSTVVERPIFQEQEDLDPKVAKELEETIDQEPSVEPVVDKKVLKELLGLFDKANSPNLGEIEAETAMMREQAIWMDGEIERRERAEQLADIACLDELHRDINMRVWASRDEAGSILEEEIPKEEAARLAFTYAEYDDEVYGPHVKVESSGA